VDTSSLNTAPVNREHSDPSNQVDGWVGVYLGHASTSRARWLLASSDGKKLWVVLNVGAGTTWGVVGIDSPLSSPAGF